MLVFSLIPHLGCYFYLAAFPTIGSLMGRVESRRRMLLPTQSVCPPVSSLSKDEPQALFHAPHESTDGENLVPTCCPQSFNMGVPVGRSTCWISRPKVLVIAGLQVFNDWILKSSLLCHLHVKTILPVHSRSTSQDDLRPGSNNTP